jgi:hypothetical protein
MSSNFSFITNFKSSVRLGILVCLNNMFDSTPKNQVRPITNNNC